jgi:hypothetical protein
LKAKSRTSNKCSSDAERLGDSPGADGAGFLPDVPLGCLGIVELKRRSWTEKTIDLAASAAMVCARPHLQVPAVQRS